MTDFGASFKNARQAKGISLDQIALETRISTRFLQAIENEEFQFLPGGIFNRGFVRTFAERVGLDPEQAVADYERLAQIQEPAEPARSANPIPEKVDRHLYPIAIGALALLIIIFYIVTRNSRITAESVNEKTSISQPPPPIVTAPATAPAVVPAPDPIVVEIEAREKTWIRVSADGSSGGDGETLEPGATRRLTAQRLVNLAIGNAGGISLKVNGQAIENLGRSGQVREFTITPEGVR